MEWLWATILWDPLFCRAEPNFCCLAIFCKDETERSSESSGSACDLKAKLLLLPKRVTQKQRERKSFLGFKKFLPVLCVCTSSLRAKQKKTLKKCSLRSLFWEMCNYISYMSAWKKSALAILISTLLQCQQFPLSFSEPRTEILGDDQELFVDYASSLNLTCLVISPNPPAFVFWKLSEKVNPDPIYLSFHQ